MRLQADFNAKQEKLKTQFDSKGTFNVGLSSSGAVVKDHNLLNNRDMADQHPIKAITGLEDAIQDVDNLKQIQPISNKEIENILNLFN